MLVYKHRSGSNLQRGLESSCLLSLVAPYQHAHFGFLGQLLNKLVKKIIGGSDGKESACSAGDLGLIPGWERSPGENGNPLQYSCLENPMDGGA